MSLVHLLVVALFGSSAAAEPLVDCGKKEYQRPNSARSLYLWSEHAEKTILKAQKQGLFGVPDNQARGDAVGVSYCPKMISMRGSAHCKEPANPEYRKALARLIKLCAEAATPPKGATLVDCKNKRYVHTEASVDLLLRWVDLALGGLEDLPEREAYRIKAKCDDAEKHAGTAYCKAPKDPRTRAAMDRVKSKCAAVRAARQARKEAEAKAARGREAARKANRKILPFPRSTYKGGDRVAVARAMKRALLKSGLAKSAREVLRVQPMGRWSRGRYTDTKRRYKKITGLVLWWDKDKDGVCRFTSYNFIQDTGLLKAKSFCMGCPEGWTRCK